MGGCFDHTRVVKGRKLGSFLSCTLTMIYEEAPWLHHVYGGLVDVSLRAVRDGAEYSTLTEMYLEELLDGVPRNAWWHPVRLLENEDLRRVAAESGSVPFSVPLENVAYRGDLFPDSLVMGRRMHVFILRTDDRGDVDILDPRVGSMHEHIRTPLALPDGRNAIKLPCDGYRFDWRAFVGHAHSLGERRLLSAKQQFAKSVFSSHEQITKAKADQVREMISAGELKGALTSNLFHPVMTARKVGFDDDSLWDGAAAVKQSAATSAHALYALHLRISGALLGRDDRQAALAALASLEAAERKLAQSGLRITRW